MMTATATTVAPLLSSSAFIFLYLLARAQYVIHQDYLLARTGFKELPELQRLAAVLALGPVNLVGAERFAQSVGDRQSRRRRGNDRELRNDGAELRMRAQQPAQPHRQHPLMLVISHRDRNLEVFVGMQTAGIFEVAVAESAGISKHPDDFILGGNDVHVGAFIVYGRPGSQVVRSPNP